MAPTITAGRRTKESKGDRREAAILDAAARLFADRSYDSVTIDELARAAGVSRTGFYFYFRTKQDVLTALLNRYWDASSDAHVWFSSTGPSPELLRQQLAESARLWLEHAGVLSCAPAALASSTELREFAARVRTRHNTRAADKIARDQGLGLASDVLSATRLAEMVAAIRDARYAELSPAASDAELQEAVDDLSVAILRLVYGGTATSD